MTSETRRNDERPLLEREADYILYQNEDQSIFCDEDEAAPGRCESGILETAALRSDMREVIDGLAENAALIGQDGTILAINRSWKQTIEAAQAWHLGVGCNYQSFWDSEAAAGDAAAGRIADAFRKVATGGLRRAVRLCHSPARFGGRHFKAVYSRLPCDDDFLVLASVHELTEVHSLRRQLRRLGSSILQAQEDERRRIARDLHDGTAQLIVGLQLSLMQLRGAKLDPDSADLVDDCSDTLARMQAEIRALSFMFHPPALKRNNLAIALTRLFEGFGTRTDMHVHFTAAEIGPVAASVESTMYRIAQEALTNVHRHSRAKHVSAELLDQGDVIHLIIGDDGIGFDSSGAGNHAVGVGIQGMRERVGQLGGRIAFCRLDPGTAIIASLPRKKACPLDLEGDPEGRKHHNPRNSKCA